MNPSALRYSGVAAVVVLWTTMSVGSVRARFDLLGTRPLSYLAEDPGAALLFGAGLVVAAILLVGFHRYVRERYPVTPAFSWLMLGGLAGQLVAGIVPIGGDGISHFVHTTSALILGASLPVFMWRFAASQPAGAWRWVSYALFWGEAAACAIGLFLSNRGVAPLAEIVPAALFHLWIVTLTMRPWPEASDDQATRPVARAERSTIVGLVTKQAVGDQA